MTESPTSQFPAPGSTPILKDGAALDRLSDAVERWAKKYPHPEDQDARHTAYREKFLPQAHKLAAQCTPGPRSFTGKDWILAVLLWLIIAGAVLALSVLFMQPAGGWFWFFVAVAVVIFVAGIATVWFETASPARARAKYASKVEWLLGAAERTGNSILNERSGS